jgi:hypothetical protein
MYAVIQKNNDYIITKNWTAWDMVVKKCNTYDEAVKVKTECDYNKNMFMSIPEDCFEEFA